MTDSEFMTAKEKETVLKQWIVFIKNGFRFKHFTGRLYSHLTLHCSFIAHYDIHGFYNTYFVHPGDRARFLRQFDRDHGWKSVEYGWTVWLTDTEFNDINQAMCDAIDPYKRAIYGKCEAVEKEMDVRRATALLAKHGIEFGEPAMQT